MKKLVVLSGAGVSAESGVKTFRDAGGLWEGHDVMEVASPKGWRKNPELVLDFYNKRRRQLFDVEPNQGHKIIAELEKYFNVTVITQNVDNLHERAGSTDVLHLHGELLKARSVHNDNDIIDCTFDINLGDLHTDGHQLRPHIVWFGEAVPAIPQAIHIVEQADYLIVIGTSLQVYPAAGLIDYARIDIPVFYVDPNPGKIPSMHYNIETIPMTGSLGMEIVKNKLLSSM